MAETQWPQGGTLLTEKGADSEGSMFPKQISNLTILLTNAPSATRRRDMAGLQGPLLCPTVPPALEESSSQKGAESESSGEGNTAGDDVLQRHQLPRRLLRAKSVLRHIQT